ncbi:unnamed protein product, partial [Rotaria sp. Silwood1]
MYRRRALIIGNNDYQREKLNNCVKDAKDFADVLKQKCNCQVDLELNLKSEDMHDSINKFTLSIKMDEFIIFYFSGHAAQWRNQNFLLPCDNNNITSASNMHRYAINAQSIIDDMAEMNPQVVVFLFDCCRSYYMPTTKSNTSNKQIGGLNEMKASEKTLIAFPCAVGQVLLNQTEFENNGLFTKYLIKHIATPNVHIETVLFKVANDIVKESGNAQRLYRVGCLDAEVFLVEHVVDTSKGPEQKSNPSNLSIMNFSRDDKKSVVRPNIHNIQEDKKDALTKVSNSNVLLPSEQQETNLKSEETKTNNHIIERKAIDISGKLGTTYDATIDKILEHNHVQAMKNCISGKRSVCKVFSGDRSTDLISYLERMNFNDAIRQSLLLRMIEPS